MLVAPLTQAPGMYRDETINQCAGLDLLALIELLQELIQFSQIASAYIPGQLKNTAKHHIESSGKHAALAIMHNLVLFWCWSWAGVDIQCQLAAERVTRASQLPHPWPLGRSS